MDGDVDESSLSVISCVGHMEGSGKIDNPPERVPLPHPSARGVHFAT